MVFSHSNALANVGHQMEFMLFCNFQLSAFLFDLCVKVDGLLLRFFNLVEFEVE